ncbi:MAG: 6-bladed beta-propeller [Bacteroidia bacterium]|nr:6-bladed beta-propeller [Bacteroidia bacterium]
MNRRSFLATGTQAAIAATALSGFTLLRHTPDPESEIIGHGHFRYKVHRDWGTQDAARFPVDNCHEMILDNRGRLIMITDDTRNNILIYDRSGKILDAWGTAFPGGHGLTHWDAGGEEFLFISDFTRGEIIKTTLDGRVLMTLGHPSTVGAYQPGDGYHPTETAIGPNGDIYVADGYGSQYVLQYTATGEFVRKFGGWGSGDAQFDTAHGVCIDTRSAAGPTLLVTSRVHNAFKRFTLDGQYLETIWLPGAFVCRPVIHGRMLYAGVCWSRLRYLNQTDNSGFVTILDDQDRVVSNPGGTAPVYKKGELQLMVQATPVFKHCHDVCIDNDDNIYVCQWNADKTYPIKLARV